MPRKILLLTVGGSHQPIVTAIQSVTAIPSISPERVIFICSDGPRGSKSLVIGSGTPCEVRRGTEVIERLPNIPTQVNLGDRFQPDRDLVLVHNPDDLSECYRLVSEKIRNLQQEFSEIEIMADYTGGTKTMSVALAMAALDYKVNVYLTTNITRENLNKVERGEQFRRATVASVTVARTIEQSLPPFLQQYNYPAAIAELKNLLQSIELSPEDNLRVQKLLNYCTALDAWDRFDHAESWEFLRSEIAHNEIRAIALFLKRVMASRKTFSEAVGENFKPPETMRGHGYEIVEDLLLNAERRATLQRWDDAVARLYRALELLAQVRLWEAYQIKTGDVDLQKLPEPLRQKYEAMRQRSSKIQLALSKSYELLNELPDEPLGLLYGKRGNTIMNALQVRNYSILAHGLRPVTASDYGRLSEVIVSFIKDGIAAVIPSNSRFQAEQFPRSLSL